MCISQNIAKCCKVPFVSRGPKYKRWISFFFTEVWMQWFLCKVNVMPEGASLTLHETQKGCHLLCTIPIAFILRWTTEKWNLFLKCIANGWTLFEEIEKMMIFNTFEMHSTQHIAECCKVPFVSRGPIYGHAWNIFDRYATMHRTWINPLWTTVKNSDF